jgi:hypothetical protein
METSTAGIAVRAVMTSPPYLQSWLAEEGARVHAPSEARSKATLYR